MIDCKNAGEKIHEYLDGSLDEAARRELLGHVEACVSCRARLDQWEQAVSALEGLRPIEPPATMLHQVMALVQERATNPKLVWRKLLYRVFVPASAALGLLLLLLPSSGLLHLFSSGADTTVPTSDVTSSVLGESGQALQGLANQGVDLFDTMLTSGAIAQVGVVLGACLILLAAGVLLWHLLDRERTRRMLRV
ncbi:MAG: zf-HC2 domain-containing protein [Chloroflexi bacterium]|nr:zf-HC2 domain-containing protein [Chloroflexota bacterium]